MVGPMRLQKALYLLLKRIGSMSVQVHTLKGGAAMLVWSQACLWRCVRTWWLSYGSDGRSPSSRFSGPGVILDQFVWDVVDKGALGQGLFFPSTSVFPSEYVGGEVLEDRLVNRRNLAPHYVILVSCFFLPLSSRRKFFLW